MRVAALYDIHGNLPALEAVLRDVRNSHVDQIVVGGDVLPGPLPRETLHCLLNLELPVHFIQGNGELAALAQISALTTGLVTYWGTTSGKPLPESLQVGYRWTAQQIQPDYASVIASWLKTLRLEIEGVGQVLFCHGTPRSETELFTKQTADEHLLPLLKDLNVSMVVCGHTHMQFDRMVGNTRVVNAGSVGEPFGEPSAYWLLLGPDVQLRYSSYDVARAAALMRATQYPLAEESANGNLHPPSEQEMLELFRKYEV